MLKIGQEVFVEGELGVIVAVSELGGHYSVRFPDGEIVENIWRGEIDTDGQLELPV